MNCVSVIPAIKREDPLKYFRLFVFESWNYFELVCHFSIRQSLLNIYEKSETFFCESEVFILSNLIAIRYTTLYVTIK
jgi:hypothetical protein